MKKKLFVLILLLTLSMIPVFTTTAITPIIPGSTATILTPVTYPCTEGMPQPVPGTPGASVPLHVDVGTDDPAAAAKAWITVELYDTEEVDEGDLYVNGFGPIDLPETGDGNTDTFEINIPVGWLVSGVNEFEFEYAMPWPSAGYAVNALSLTVEYGELELVEWYGPYAGGYEGWNNYLTMNVEHPQNPEWLKLWTNTDVHSNTTIIIQGKDTYGQNIEAKLVIPLGTPSEQEFIFNDTHTDPPRPVTFSEITGILQQNGTHCNSFLIETKPYPFEQYLGVYKPEGLQGYHGWEPNYKLPQGDGKAPIPQDVPVEPANPDPIKILINWKDKDGDLYPDIDIDPTKHELGKAAYASTIYIEGLDAYGRKVVVSVDIPKNAEKVLVDETCGANSWSTICKVWGGTKGDSYYILTEPMDQRPLFTYHLRIHHMTIHPDSYDILAYPDECGTGHYPGVTDITVALRDIDDNLLHWGMKDDDILVNFASSGGTIQPSNDIRIKLCEITAKANLTADTNPRTVKVSASANVPETDNCPAMNLYAWTEITFDGVNSVLFEGEPLHAMMWGYETHYYNEASTNVNKFDILTARYTGPVPPKPWLPPELGGPEPTGRKLDGPIYEVMIPLYVGCNLISCPVHPMLCTHFNTGWGGSGIPMGLLFGKTSATDCIEAIWWYDPVSSGWHSYIPSTGAGAEENFKDGVGYWIKAEKACTIEVSGVVMENAPFTPPEYTVTPSWNLKGFTSAVPMKTDDYLESLGVGDWEFYGPIWTYDAKYGTWTRNPETLYPTNGFWMYYKANNFLTGPTIAP